MTTKRLASTLVLGLGVVLVASLSGISALQAPNAQIALDNDDIGGVVNGSRGPEAGVWVIAETTDLNTKLVKIVVTDDGGRYVLPDLPNATYRVWVRGYGLVDSPAVRTTPGKAVNLTAVPAPDPRAAAQYYPAGYWFSLLKVPGTHEFPGTGPEGNGIAPGLRSQAEWVRNLKSGGCWACHQLGNKATREIPKALGNFPSTVAAWDRRVKSESKACPRPHHRRRVEISPRISMAVSMFGRCRMGASVTGCRIRCSGR